MIYISSIVPYRRWNPIYTHLLISHNQSTYLSEQLGRQLAYMESKEAHIAEGGKIIGIPELEKGSKIDCPNAIGAAAPNGSRLQSTPPGTAG